MKYMLNSELFISITGRRYVYSIMPVANISSVVEKGILSYNEAERIDHISIADSEVQKRRKNLHNLVNLYFDFRNPMFYRICKSSQEPICVLVVSCQVLDIPNCIVSDMNAAKELARLDSPETGLMLIDFAAVYSKNWNDEDRYVKSRKSGIKCAEVLLPGRVDYNYIAGAIVKTKDDEIVLKEKGFTKRITVDSDVFY